MKAMRHHAKTLAGKKLASYGRGPNGMEFNDHSPYDGVPFVSESDKVGQAQRVPTRKRGGKVDGESSVVRLDRKPRASGGKVHSDAAEDKKLIAKMIKADDKRHERAGGGRIKSGKGKTSINIIVGTPQHAGMATPASQPPARVPLPVPMAPPPSAAMGGPAGMPPVPAGAGMMPPMRARGGKVSAVAPSVKKPSYTKEGYCELDYGGGGGLGRLQKAKAQ